MVINTPAPPFPLRRCSLCSRTLIHGVDRSISALAVDLCADRGRRGGMKRLIRRIVRVADASHCRAPGKGASAPRRRVPGGHVPVCVGEEMERFAVRAELLGRPAFVELLRRSAQEYGYAQRGVLRIHCPRQLRFSDLTFLLHGFRCFSIDTALVFPNILPSPALVYRRRAFPGYSVSFAFLLVLLREVIMLDAQNFPSIDALEASPGLDFFMMLMGLQGRFLALQLQQCYRVFETEGTLPPLWLCAYRLWDCKEGSSLHSVVVAFVDHS
ncbi:hypothetical protein ZIOFF_004462 [Zingiber officinale]|uniref:Uncharacterized protein n=1 Tax=Zingiber officinale TaxID=94328 RepID=A0A8J5IP61_ZINOF|nr:hypothetical protein ZIOFF_004462 [Zingiber officinale]